MRKGKQGTIPLGGADCQRNSIRNAPDSFAFAPGGAHQPFTQSIGGTVPLSHRG